MLKAAPILPESENFVLLRDFEELNEDGEANEERLPEDCEDKMLIVSSKLSR